MIEGLITDSHRHQAEQIFGLNDWAHRAMDAERFSAAVGAFRVIAEIGACCERRSNRERPRADGADSLHDQATILSDGGGLLPPHHRRRRKGGA
jgi:hypothetical protein